MASEVTERASLAEDLSTMAADGTNTTVAPSEDGRSIAEESVAVSTIAIVGSRITGPDDEEGEGEQAEEETQPPPTRRSLAKKDEATAAAAAPAADDDETPDADDAVIAEAEAAEAATVAADGDQAPTPVPLEAPAAAAKKKFVAQASPKCNLCGKPVYKKEEVLDATDRVFHKNCLRCKTCKTPLVGRQPVTDESVLALTKAQFRPAADGLFCDKHAQRTRGTLVQGTLGRDAADARLAEKAAATSDPALRDKTRAIKQEMEVMVGDSAPVCARCGGPLEGHGAVIVSGMERFHQKCPDAPAEVPRTVRYFVKKAEERPVVQVRCDARADAKAVSFLFDLDAESKRAALLQTKAALAEIVYKPDAEARSGLARKLPAGRDTTVAGFGAELRHDRELSAMDPAGWTHAPAADCVLRGPATLLGSGSGKAGKSRAVLATLVARPDPVLCAYATEEDMLAARKPVARLLLDPESVVTRVDAGAESGPGVVVSGRALAAAKGSKGGEDVAAEELSELALQTEFAWQAHAWAHAAEGLLAALQSGALDNDGEQTLVFRLFAVRGGVLQQHVLSFAYRPSGDGELLLRDNAYLFLSEFPEKSQEQQQKADPLAALKEVKREKAAEAAEQERLAQIGDAKQAAPGGGCCVVM